MQVRHVVDTMVDLLIMILTTTTTTGWIHLATNGLIQLRIGGYLNLLFGTPRWFFIYFAAGVYDCNYYYNYYCDYYY